MKPPPRLRLEPRASRLACATLVAGCALMGTLVVSLPLDRMIAAAALLSIAFVAVRGIRRCTGRGVPALMHVGHDRRIAVTMRDGRTFDGAILDASYVGARLTTIVWRPDRSSRLAPARSILILPDMLPAEDFRRLRVMLRYGRPQVIQAVRP
jgi:hypothetical protein